LQMNQQIILYGKINPQNITKKQTHRFNKKSNFIRVDLSGIRTELSGINACIREELSGIRAYVSGINAGIRADCLLSELLYLVSELIYLVS
jgi:hypothetical protein